MSLIQLSNIVIMLLVIVLAAASYRYYMLTREQHRQALVRRRERNNGAFLLRAYRLFTRLPLTRRYFFRIQNRLRNVYPADEAAIGIEASRIMIRSIVIAMAGVIFTLYVSRGDIIYMAMGFMTIGILFSFVNRHSLKRIEMKLLRQFSSFIDGVRENYSRCGRVDDAVRDLLDTLPVEISLHAERIHQILTSTNILEDAADYADISPNRFMTTFVEIASTTMEYGDKKLSHGESLFLHNLSFLKEEINTELLRQQENDAKFTGVAGISIMPVFFLKPIAWYWISNIPEVAPYYRGAYGTISMALVFAISLICYRGIEFLKDSGRSQEVRENGITRRAAEIPGFRRLIYGQVSRNYSKAVREEEMLRFTGDHLGINAFIARRYITAAAAGIIMAIVLCTSVVRDKRQIFTDFAEEFETTVVPESYKSIMEDTAKKYMHKTGNLRNGTTDEERQKLINDITENSDVKEQKYAEIIADSLSRRQAAAGKIYFHWWYLFIIGGVTWLGYMGPLWMLMFKQSSVKMEMEDEVSQFQTIVLMLMHVDGCSISMIMDWMERFAYCFRSSISECIYEMPHGTNKALRDLLETETFTPFQNFVSDLMNVDNVGVEQAFSGIEIDRDYYKSKRKEDNEAILKKKSNAATLLCFIPLFFILFAYFIFPVAAYALEQLSSFSI